MHSRISADYHTWAFAYSVCPLQMDTHLYLWGPPPTSCTSLLHPREKLPLASCPTLSRNLTAPCELRVSHLANGLSAASHTQLHQYHHMAEGQRKQVFLEALEISLQKNVGWSSLWMKEHCFQHFCCHMAQCASMCVFAGASVLTSLQAKHRAVTIHQSNIS